MTNPPEWLRRAQSQWTNTGATRPPFAQEPGPGQESVWDYPRPPVVVPDKRLVVVGNVVGQVVGTVVGEVVEDPAGVVVDGGRPLASTRSALRVLETASPPTFYLPFDDVDLDRLTEAPGASMCEWKGRARYWALVDDPSTPIAWDYPEPFGEFAALARHLSFYPGRIRCTVDGELVRPQAGGFYGGWITDEIVGPFKGEPGTGGW